MPEKTTYKLRLDEIISAKELKELSVQDKTKLKGEIGELLYDLVLKDTAGQRSAVSGRMWPGLSKQYKKIKSKVAPAIANLELTGAMLDALEIKQYRDGIEFGIFGGENAQKSDNHNKFSAKSLNTSLPKRQFIPKKDESFRPGIKKELVKLAKEIISDKREALIENKS